MTVENPNPEFSETEQSTPNEHADEQPESQPTETSESAELSTFADSNSEPDADVAAAVAVAALGEDSDAASEPQSDTAENTSENTGETEDSEIAKDTEQDSPKRDPRIPEVITNRTLFFLAPDLPPLSELMRQRRNNKRDEQDDEEDSRGRRGRRRGRRSGSRQDSNRADDRRDDEREDENESTEPQAVKGSTRLAAKRARRRDNRDLGRRRTVVTESEFQARRESVDRKMLVRSKNNRVQIGVLEDNVLVEHYVARNEDVSLIGNVYLGRVQNVLPSMEAAFVDIGEARNAVLYSGEVDWAAAELGPNQPRKIENALKPGDRVLVQVTKDPVGQKGARLTSQISLPGRYLVYVPGNTMNGISRKLPENERSRLKKILKEVLPEGVGVIVRTAAEGATHEQLQRDVERLMRQWEDIQKRSGSNAKAPQTLHAEPDMLIKIIRDVFNEDFEKLIIQGQSEYDTIRNYLGQVAPDLLERVERYTDEDIFAQHRVNDMIDKALARKVFLPSGGSLVIDRTEAMTVIDVNTGKFVGSGGNLEETVTKNNLEAAEEIVRQLRLRDIGGIIVIDFIDMVLDSNRNLVHRRLLEGLSRDRTKHQVAEVTSLGLVQMTRKKIGLGLLETFSEPCTSCAGRGVHVHSEPVNQSSSSGGRGNKQNRRGRGNKQSQQQSTHEITDDARNALTKIAASTIADTGKAEAAEAAETLAKAAQLAAQGKSADEVLAAAGQQRDGDDSNDSSGKDSRDSGRKRSRRGRRGRGKSGKDAGEQSSGTSRERDGGSEKDSERATKESNESATTDRQEHPEQDAAQANQPSKAKQPTASDSDTQPRERKPRRRRVVTDTLTTEEASERARLLDGLELPEPRERQQEVAQESSADFASLDAALDQLSSASADDSDAKADRKAETNSGAKADRKTSDEPGHEPETSSDSSNSPASAQPSTPAKKPRRRRVTTGTISTQEGAEPDPS